MKAEERQRQWLDHRVGLLMASNGVLKLDEIDELLPGWRTKPKDPAPRSLQALFAQARAHAEGQSHDGQ